MGIERSTLYRHLANIRKIFRVNNYAEMMQSFSGSKIDVHSEVQLTPRGAEVFTLILSGMSDRHIAEHLGISYSAVRRHKEKMLQVNKCGTIKELIAKHHGHFAIDENMNT